MFLVDVICGMVESRVWKREIRNRVFGLSRQKLGISITAIGRAVEGEK